MMRALFSGVTGLRTHQTRMDVIGNNISNVNTLGFKKSAANFSDLYSETVAPASAPAGNQGGVNARQIGLGVTCNSIVIKHTPGAAQYTGNTLDLAISGDGFFCMRTPTGEQYSRAGNLSISSNGSLVNPNGFFVQCYNSTYKPGDAGVASTVGMNNATGTGLINFNWQGNPAVIETAASGAYTYEVNNNNRVDVYKNGVKVQTDLAILDGGGAEVTRNVGFEAGKVYSIQTDLGTMSFTIADRSPKVVGLTNAESGSVKNVNFTKNANAVNAATTGTYTYTIDAATNELVAWLGTVEAGRTATGIPNPPVPGTEYTMTTALGTIKFTADSNDLPTTLADLNAVLAKANVTVNPSTNEGPANYATAINNITTMVENSGVTVKNNDAFIAGNRIGDMIIDQDAYENISINEDGAVIGQLKREMVPPGIVGATTMAKGEKVILGYLAVANFTNTEGLEKVSANMYATTANSGRVTHNLAGAGGTGRITPSSLEMSNVDISEEMVNMITTQRGFQANSRIITTTDAMLEELINLKR